MVVIIVIEAYFHLQLYRCAQASQDRSGSCLLSEHLQEIQCNKARALKIILMSILEFSVYKGKNTTPLDMII